jgi:hypothetical protein
MRKSPTIVTVFVFATFASSGCAGKGANDSLGDDTSAQSGTGTGAGAGAGAGTVAADGNGTGTGGGAHNGTGGGGGTGGGMKAVLNTYSKVWVSGDDKGPAMLSKKTGAGTIDASFAWDTVAYAADKTKVDIATIYTRSDATPNANDSYLAGRLRPRVPHAHRRRVRSRDRSPEPRGRSHLHAAADRVHEETRRPHRRERGQRREQQPAAGHVRRRQGDGPARPDPEQHPR